jgi:hypothetical protein
MTLFKIDLNETDFNPFQIIEFDDNEKNLRTICRQYFDLKLFNLAVILSKYKSNLASRESFHY